MLGGPPSRLYFVEATSTTSWPQGTGVAAFPSVRPSAVPGEDKNLLDSLKPLAPILSVLLSAGHCQPAAAPAVSAEQAVLTRRTDGLRKLIAAAENGPLVPFDRVLVVVDQHVVQDVLISAVPWERTVGERYRLQVTGAEVDFEDGFALVRLDGRVSLAAGLDTDVFAEAQVFAGLDVVELDPGSGILRGKLSLIAFDAHRVDIFGEGPVREGLVEDFGRQRLEAFADLASSVDIPVRFEKEMEIPAAGPEGPVSIAAATIPIRLALADAKAFRGKLWICVAADAGTPAQAAPPTSGATGGEP